MDDDILKEFLAESWENLGRLDAEIVELEKHPGDKALLGSIFRTIHTIKGTCGFIGLSGLGAVAHSAENVLGKMRDGDLAASPATISPVLEAVDEIKFLLHGLETTGAEPQRDNSGLIRQLDQIADQAKPGGEATSVPAAVAPPAPPVVSSPAATSPAVAAQVTTAQVTATSPMAPVPAPVADEPVAAVTDTASHGLTETSRGIAEAPAAEGEAGKSVADLTIRVNVDVVDRLMNLVGELVLTRNQLLQMVRGEDESKYAAPVSHLNRVTTDLQEAVMKTRMQPIGNAWNKLPASSATSPSSWASRSNW